MTSRKKVRNLSNDRLLRAKRAAVLAAMGLSGAVIAQRMGVTTVTVRNWKREFPAVWLDAEKAAAEEMARLVQEVRETAGTDRMMEDPDLHVAKAGRAATWLRASGQELFPPGDSETLWTFYQRYYLPVRLGDATEGTKKTYAIVLGKWRVLTGDPPLKQISAETLARFRDALTASAGLVRFRKKSKATIRGYLSTVQSVLDLAGPPHPRLRDAAGILKEVPWIRPPRKEMRPAKTVSETHANAAYLAAAGMDYPKVPGIKAPAWWKALLAVAFNTALRRGSLFKLRMEWIDWAGRRIVIPPQAMKGNRGHIVPLNECAYRHLLGIRTDREMVFPLPGILRQFHFHLHKLLDRAAIPRGQHFGLHDLRKTHATILFGESPAAAQLSLAHTGMGTTIGHYVQAEGIIARAVNALPQPSAFMPEAKGGAA